MIVNEGIFFTFISVTNLFISSVFRFINFSKDTAQLFQQNVYYFM